MSKTSLSQYMESIKDSYPRLYSEYHGFNLLVEKYSVEIAKCYQSLPPDSVVCVSIRPFIKDHDDICESGAHISFGYSHKTSIQSLEVVKEVAQQNEAIYALLEVDRTSDEFPVFCRWEWSEEMVEYHGFHIGCQPMWTIQTVKKPFSWESPFGKTTGVSARPKKSPQKTEKELEHELLSWLHSLGVQADNQVSTSKHRMDLWIPGYCFLELKKTKVSGDDVCQAIDYCAEYKKPVILVGNHISEMASRGIEAFNKAVGSEMIVFISWSGIRTYLRGLLNL